MLYSFGNHIDKELSNVVGTQFGVLVAQCDSHVANLCEQQMNAFKIVKKSGLAGN